MDKATFKKLMLEEVEMWPGQPMSTKKLEEYYGCLGQLEPEELARRFREHRKTGKYFPLVSELTNEPDSRDEANGRATQAYRDRVQSEFEQSWRSTKKATPEQAAPHIQRLREMGFQGMDGQADENAHQNYGPHPVLSREQQMRALIANYKEENHA